MTEKVNETLLLERCFLFKSVCMHKIKASPVAAAWQHRCSHVIGADVFVCVFPQEKLKVLTALITCTLSLAFVEVSNFLKRLF